MTIHQAKGLEYPIVILPKLATGNRQDRTKVIVNRTSDPATGQPRNTLDIQIGRVGSGVHTPGFDKERERSSPTLKSAASSTSPPPAPRTG